STLHSVPTRRSSDLDGGTLFGYTGIDRKGGTQCGRFRPTGIHAKGPAGIAYNVKKSFSFEVDIPCGYRKIVAVLQATVGKQVHGRLVGKLYGIDLVAVINNGHPPWAKG